MRREAKRRGWTRYSRLSYDTLIYYLKNEKILKSMTVNDQDYFTLEPLPFPFFMYWDDQTRSYYGSDGIAMAKYLMSTCDFRNVITRNPLTEEIIRDLDKFLNKIGYKCEPLIDLWLRAADEKRRRFAQQERVRSLETECELLIEDILSIACSCTIDVCVDIFQEELLPSFI